MIGTDMIAPVALSTPSIQYRLDPTTVRPRMSVMPLAMPTGPPVAPALDVEPPESEPPFPTELVPPFELPLPPELVPLLEVELPPKLVLPLAPGLPPELVLPAELDAPPEPPAEELEQPAVKSRAMVEPRMSVWRMSVSLLSVDQGVFVPISAVSQPLLGR